MRIRAVVLEETGGELAAQEVEFAQPRRKELLVRLGDSGVCHSDYNAVDVREANRAATRKAIGVCVEGRDPAAAALVERRDSLRNPFYRGG